MDRPILHPRPGGGHVGLRVLHVVRAQQTPPKPPPPVEPSRTPFGKTVAGAGIVEPANEASGTSAVSVGSQQAGLVVAGPREDRPGGEGRRRAGRDRPADLRGPGGQRVATQAARAALAQAQTQQHLADDTYQRDLASPSATTDQQLVQDRDNAEVAASAVKSAEANIELAQANLQRGPARTSTSAPSGRRRPGPSSRSTCGPASTSPSLAARA